MVILISIETIGTLITFPIRQTDLAVNINDIAKLADDLVPSSRKVHLVITSRTPLARCTSMTTYVALLAPRSRCLVVLAHKATLPEKEIDRYCYEDQHRRNAVYNYYKQLNNIRHKHHLSTSGHLRTPPQLIKLSRLLNRLHQR